MEIQINSFEAWVRYVFDHAVHVQQQAWYFDINAPVWNETREPAVTVAYMTQLFDNAAAVCAPYSDEQLNQGFWFLVSNAGSSHMFTLLDEAVPIPERERCIWSMAEVFRQLFAVRCSPHLSHTLHTYEPDVNPLNSACYMWWDIIPIGGNEPHYGWLNRACIDVMEQTLQLHSLACQESALHGLGHWKTQDAKRVEAVIDTYLTNNLNTPLSAYANAARSGCVL